MTFGLGEVTGNSVAGLCLQRAALGGDVEFVIKV